MLMTWVTMWTNYLYVKRSGFVLYLFNSIYKSTLSLQIRMWTIPLQLNVIAAKPIASIKLFFAINSGALTLVFTRKLKYKMPKSGSYHNLRDK